MNLDIVLLRPAGGGQRRPPAGQGRRCPRFLRVAETDLCVLLSNALENALHACQRLRAESKDCDIEAVAYEKSGKILFTGVQHRGPTSGFRKGLPVTEAEGHGIGVRSICSIVSATTAYIPLPQITVQYPADVTVM